ARPATENLISTGGGRKEYTVNGLRALKAQGSEDPLKIAFEYNIDYQNILTYNDLMQGEHFKDGEYVYLQPKKNRGAEKDYLVASGESMRDIAQKFGIKIMELYAKNDMNFTANEQAYAGERISLQEKTRHTPRVMSYAQFLKTQDNLKSAVSKPETGSTGGPPSTTTTNPISQYEVQPSDTLYSIAHKFNVSVEQLKSINNLSDTDIKAGQTLLVSK
ncbi:MAG TPA: LysM peptidoglycan-binding domain-containing protein, partial [Chitinophagales bacterium]|nr:LysM peptidoglycan-binding domain-containing protein [Chitinophagales bacterium]